MPLLDFTSSKFGNAHRCFVKVATMKTINPAPISIKNPAPLGAGFLCGQYRIRTCDPRPVKAML